MPEHSVLRVRCEYCQQQNYADSLCCQFCGAHLPDLRVAAPAWLPTYQRYRDMLGTASSMVDVQREDCSGL
jgi:hypothetical protein